MTFDGNSAIPPDPAEQYSLVRETDNRVHELDPPQSYDGIEPISQEPFPFRLMTARRLATMSIQMKVLNMAKSQLGYHEDPSGNTKFGIWYGNRPEINSSAYDAASWCDMFACRCAYDIGGDALVNIFGLYAYTPWHAAYLHKKGVTGRPDKLPTGALAFQNWDLNGTGNGNLDKIDHVEFVETDHGDGTATYVGGNVSNAVKRTRRSKAYLVVVAEWWKLLPFSPAPFMGNDDYYLAGWRC